MPQSTRLENLHWDAAGARLDVGGRTVGLRAEQHGPALAAVQAFYDEALSAYSSGAVVDRPAPSKLPEWLRPAQWVRRIRSLFAHVLSHATGLPLPPPAAAPAPSTAPAARPPPPPAPSAVPKVPAPRPGDAPVLRSAYADDAGVHVIWAAGGAGRRAKETELLYSFDSAVAARLQACYSGLAELGHEVVDLRVWRKDAVASVSAPAPAKPSPPVPAAKPDVSRVMRLHPEPGDTPGRAVVSPVGDDKNLQVLTAPERLVAALHAAADPKRPAAERLTHLRCAASRGALKVVAVGLGENKEDPATPGRWENIATWWEQAKRTVQLAPAAPAPKPGPEPELF